MCAAAGGLRPEALQAAARPSYRLNLGRATQPAVCPSNPARLRRKGARRQLLVRPGTFARTVPCAELTLFWVYLCPSGGTDSGLSPPMQGPSSSHLHFLQHLEPFNLSNAIMIQINVLKQDKT